MRKYCFAFLFCIVALCMQGIAYCQLAAPAGRPKISLAGQLPPDICRELGGAAPQVGRYQAETLDVDTPLIDVNLLEVFYRRRNHGDYIAATLGVISSPPIVLGANCGYSLDLSGNGFAVNSIIYVFKAPSAGRYRFAVNGRNRLMLQSPPRMDLFEEPEFRFPAGSTLSHLGILDSIMTLVKAFCLNIGVGVDRLAYSSPDTLGPVIGDCINDGIALKTDRLYYIQVRAPHGTRMSGTFEARKCNCSGSNPNEASSRTSIRNDPNPNRDLPNPQKKIARQLNLPKRLKEYEWYSLPVQEAKRPRYKIVADFDCAIAFHTYRDAEKLRSYNPLVAKRLRDGKAKNFKLGRIPRRRELRMVVAHKSGETGSIKIQPRNKGASAPTIIQVR